ncbi:Beta-barrel assembly-enhancing protease [bacterium HR15]|nr:Beta-barrel assembly-enhancing protease [bacterium HR15]
MRGLKKLWTGKGIGLLVLIPLLALGGVCQQAPQEVVPPKLPEQTERDRQEVELGKKIVAEIEKQYKFVTDPELVERVNRIGQTLAVIARQTHTEARWGEPGPAPFEYTFRIIDEKDVNAFSVPGGFVFINKGLLDMVSSDDELAGVLAHEIAHADHRHVMALIRADNKVQQSVLLPAILVGLLGRLPSDDFMNVALGAQLYRIAKVSAFSQEAETDADLTALEYLRRSPYNPVGLLVFMERLAAEERRRPQIEWGIFRTHPVSRERVERLRQALAAYGIPIRRREVSPALRVLAVPIQLDKPDGLYRVRYEKIDIFEPADDPQLGHSRERAIQLAKTLNRLLDDGIELYEIQLTPDRRGVLVRGQELVRITDADAQLAGKSPEEIATQVREALRRLIWSESIRLMF